MNFKFTLDIKPKAVQSVRFFKGHAFQPKEVKLYKAKIKYLFRKQFPEFEIIKNKPIKLQIDYCYCYKNLPKWKKEYININGFYPKITRPDVTDNLNKGTIDALTGDIWQDDSLIYAIYAKKQYFIKDCIFLYLETISMPTSNKEFKNSLF